MSDPIVDPSKCPGTPELPRIEPLSIDCTVPEPPEPIREGRQVDTFAGSALNAVALLPNVTIVPPLPPGSNPPSSQVYPLVDCQGVRPTICAANNLSSYVGKVIRLDTCRQIQGPSSNLGQCSMLVLLNPAAGEMFEDCQTCLSCWKLTMCGSPETALVTSQNLSAYEGRIVRLMDGFCYTVERTQNCVGALPVTIIADYNGCEDCGGCYVLTRCGGEDQRTVYNDLAGLVGTIPDEVVLGGYAFQIDGECWYASDFQPSCGGSGTETEIEAWYTNCGGCGCYHLVSISDSSVVVANAAVDENGSPINLSQHLGKVAKLEDGECYRIESSSDCESPQEVTIVAIYGSNSPCQTCYELSPCDGGSNIITHSDLSLYQEGAVLKNRNDDSCWTLEGAVSCPGETVSFAASGPYSTCPDCQGVTKYRLIPSCQHEDCGGVGSSGGGHIITTTDLRLAVGQYVNVGGTCYSVEVASSGAHVTDASVAYSGPFSSCGSCSSTPFTGRIWVPYEYEEDGVLMQQPRWIVVSGGLIVGTCLGDPAPLCVCGGASFSDSESEEPTYYELTRCDDPESVILVAGADLTNPELGSVHKDNNGDCWEVTAVGVTGEPTAFAEAANYPPGEDPCGDCTGPPPETLYHLRQCANNEMQIVVDGADLTNPEIGAVYKDDQGVCWIVFDEDVAGPADAFTEDEYYPPEGDPCETCEGPTEVFHELAPCEGGSSITVSEADLDNNVALGAVYRRDDGSCWIVVEINVAGPGVPFVMTGYFPPGGDPCGDCTGGGGGDDPCVIGGANSGWSWIYLEPVNGTIDVTYFWGE